MARALSPKFDVDRFYLFCTKLSIPTKEYGIIKLNPTSTQVYLAGQIAKGIEEGVHEFVVLKCRQAMATTIVLAMDLYWSFMHEGTVGMIVGDQEERRQSFNHVVRVMVSSLKEDPDWYQPTIKENRYAVDFANLSQLIFSNANQRVKGTLGRGLGLSLVHGSECGFWNDQTNLTSLSGSMAQINPNRLAIFESTANGDNLFRRMWDTALNAVSKRAIFIGWWLQDEYTLSREDPRYKVYWNGRLNGDEEIWVNAVYNRFGIKVSQERVAWWRWHLHESKGSQVEIMLQEYPWLPEDAFQFSGSGFINRKAIRARKEEAMRSAASYFHFEFGDSFADTTLVESESALYDLAVWQPPENGAKYALGLDPSHGSNELSDWAVIEIIRCYSDRVEQVAEFSVKGMETYRLAWVYMILAIAYGDVTANIEQQGGGNSVRNEIDRVTNNRATNYPEGIADKLRGAKPYFYYRMDAVRPSFNTRDWVTNAKNREELLCDVRHYMEFGLAVVNSPDLVDEAQGLVRSEVGKVESQSDYSDDRVMAFGMALRAYVQQVIYSIEPADTWANACSTRKHIEEGVSVGDFIHGKLMGEIFK
jgi:hypothetical protein